MSQTLRPRVESLSKAAVRSLSDDELLERWEELYGLCLNERDERRLAWLRQQLDALTREGESSRRRLICWTL